MTANGPEDDLNFVVLTDEEGVEHEFEVLDVINVEDRDYAVLATRDNEDEAIVLRVEIDAATGGNILVDIEDDEEWERVAAAWEEIQDEDWDDDMEILAADDDDEDEESSLF